MPTPRPNKATAKKAPKSAAKSTPKKAVMLPDRRVKRNTYTKMAASLNNMGGKKR